MKRLALIAAPAAVAAAALGLGSASAHDSAPRTFKLVQTDLALSVVDQPPAQSEGGATRGDMVVFTKRVSTPAGRRVGTLHLVCTVTHPRATLESSVFFCDGAYALNDGQITASVATPLSGGTVRLAVTGGTGRYAGASGTIVSRSTGGDDTLDTIRLSN